MDNENAMPRIAKRGFWARETPRHYCTACGAPAPIGADGNEDLSACCPNCHMDMVLEPEGGLGERFQELRLVYDTKKVQDIITTAVCRQVNDKAEVLWHDSIVEAIKERCKAIENDVTTMLDGEKRSFIEEMTRLAVKNQCEAVVSKEVGKEVRSITKEIISGMEDQIRDRVRKSVFASFGDSHE